MLLHGAEPAAPGTGPGPNQKSESQVFDWSGTDPTVWAITSRDQQSGLKPLHLTQSVVCTLTAGADAHSFPSSVRSKSISLCCINPERFMLNHFQWLWCATKPLFQWLRLYASLHSLIALTSWKFLEFRTFVTMNPDLGIPQLMLILSPSSASAPLPAFWISITGTELGWAVPIRE